MLFFFNEQIVISRLEPSGGYHLWSTVTGTKGHIQQLNEESTAMVGGAFGKTYKMWIGVDVDCNNGDRVKGEDGKEYKILAAGVNTRDFGIEQHKEIVIQRIDFKNVSDN